MKGFSGFPQKGQLTRIPSLFFSELLSQIDHLGELKVTLYCFWRLQQKEGDVVFLSENDLRTDQAFMRGLSPRASEQESTLQDALERAAARGTLLQVQMHEGSRTENLFFVNTARGRAAVKGIEEGKWEPGANPLQPLDLTVERPGIYTLYEQNIGPLTPMIADHLRDIEETYPEEWIEEAIEIAVLRNARKLPYIEAILKNWQEKGHDSERNSDHDAQRFITGKYGDEIEY